LTAMLIEKTVFEALPPAEVKIGELARKLGVKDERRLKDVLMRLKRKGLVKIRKPFLSKERVLKVANEYPKQKCRVIAVISLKGGVGKTLTTVNLAACLAQLDKRTLIVDMDPQANATIMLKAREEPSVYGMLVKGLEAKAVIQKTAWGKLDIISSELNLVGAEVELMRPDGITQLKEALDCVRDDYDFILIDCQPSLSLLSINSLQAADSVIIPVQCDQFALQSLDKMSQTIGALSRLNPDLHIEGILISLYESDKMLCSRTISLVEEKYGEFMFETIIHKDETLSEAAEKGIPVITYKSDCEAAQSFMKIAQEVASNGG
jgi:chromosome partitioning protein